MVHMQRFRTRKVERLLRQEKADALLVWNEEGSGQPATRWLSGFSGSSSVVLIVRTPSPHRLGTSPLKRGRGEGGSCFLITDGRYTAQTRKEAQGFKIFTSSAQKPTLKILSEIIRKHKVRRILFDGSVTVHSVLEEVKEYVKKEDTPSSLSSKEGRRQEIELISRKHILQELRIVKEKEEIRLLAKAAEIACLAFTKLLPELHAGMTEKGIAKRLEDLMVEEGADGIAFPTIVASGKNGAHPHARPTDKTNRQENTERGTRYD